MARKKNIFEKIKLQENINPQIEKLPLVTNSEVNESTNLDILRGPKSYYISKILLKKLEILCFYKRKKNISTYIEHIIENELKKIGKDEMKEANEAYKKHIKEMEQV